MTKLERGLAVLSCSLIGVLFVVGSANRSLNYQVSAERQLIKQKDAVIDSIYSESFLLNTQLARFESTLDHLTQTHPEAAAEFNRYYSHETE